MPAAVVLDFLPFLAVFENGGEWFLSGLGE